MNFTEEDVINCQKVLKGDLVAPTEISNKIADYVKELKGLVYFEKGEPKINNKEEFRKICLDSFNHFSKLGSHLLVLYIREVTNEKINITYEVVPEFKEIVKEYGPLLRAARLRN